MIIGKKMVLKTHMWIDNIILMLYIVTTGEMPEWLMEQFAKLSSVSTRGFESHSLRIKKEVLKPLFFIICYFD